MASNEEFGTAGDIARAAVETVGGAAVLGGGVVIFLSKVAEKKVETGVGLLSACAGAGLIAVTEYFQRRS